MNVAWNCGLDPFLVLAFVLSWKQFRSSPLVNDLFVDVFLVHNAFQVEALLIENVDVVNVLLHLRNSSFEILHVAQVILLQHGIYVVPVWVQVAHEHLAMGQVNLCPLLMQFDGDHQLAGRELVEVQRRGLVWRIANCSQG